MIPEPSETQADEHGPRREDMEEQAFAIVNRHARAEQDQEEQDRSGEQQGKWVGSAVLPGADNPEDSHRLKTDRNGRSRSKPKGSARGHRDRRTPGRSTRPESSPVLPRFPSMPRASPTSHTTTRAIPPRTGRCRRPSRRSSRAGHASVAVGRATISRAEAGETRHGSW